MSADLATTLLVQLAFAAPLLLVWCVGIILAVTRRHEAPARSRLVVTALGLFLVTGLLGTVALSVLPFLLLRQGFGAARLGLVLSAVGAVRTLAEVGGWVLLLLALFPRRPATPNVVAGPSRSGPDGG